MNHSYSAKSSIADTLSQNSQENLLDANNNYSTQKSQQQFLAINRWTNEQVLEWLKRKMPSLYEVHKEAFIKHQITGESILELNEYHLSELGILNEHFRNELLDEISMLKMRYEYEFFKRLKSPANINNMN